MPDSMTSSTAVGDECEPGARDAAVAAPAGRRQRRPGLRIGLVGLFAVLAALVCAGPALADSASFSVTNTAGESDPAAGLPRVFTLNGNAEAPDRVYVKYRGPGGAPCAPNAREDTGSPVDGIFEAGYSAGPFWGASVEGTIHIQTVMTWRTAGTFVFCIWLPPKGGESEITVPITQTITFRSPNGTITATVNPLTPEPGQQATVTVIGDSEAPENVYAKVRPAGGAPCASTYDADSGENLINGGGVNGSFSMQAKTSQSKAGQYLLCLWLAGSGSETPVIAGPQPETFTVVSPPPPCVVPKVAAGASLASVEGELRAAGCAVGKVSPAASTTVARGGVLSLSPAPGTKLAARAAVNVVVSAGRPCVVPAVRRGSSLAHVERQLAAADCTATVSYLHSRHVRRGRVIGIAGRPRSELYPRAKVRVVVSAGRGHKR